MVKAAREITEYASVLERIDAVLSIMGGYGGTYGKGRPLVDALEDAAQGAILYGDFGLAQRFQRFVADHGVDTRRASATVVIGHSRYVSGGITPQEVAETLRTYNTHAARIEVITYETLLDSAVRMLALSSARQDPDSTEDPAA